MEKKTGKGKSEFKENTSVKGKVAKSQEKNIKNIDRMNKI